MYIHAGNGVIVSDKKIIGVFNTETIFLSDENKRFMDSIKPGDKTVIVDEFNKYITSNVSSYTVMNRKSIEGNFVWRRKNG